MLHFTTCWVLQGKTSFLWCTVNDSRPAYLSLSLSLWCECSGQSELTSDRMCDKQGTGSVFFSCLWWSMALVPGIWNPGATVDHIRGIRAEVMILLIHTHTHTNTHGHTHTTPETEKTTSDKNRPTQTNNLCINGSHYPFYYAFYVCM